MQENALNRVRAPEEQEEYFTTEGQYSTIPLSEYQLFKIKRSQRQLSNTTLKKEPQYNLILVVAALISLLICVYYYLSRQVDQPKLDHFKEINAQEAEQIFYFDNSRQQPKNLALLKTDPKLADIFLPAGISNSQMAFASKLKKAQQQFPSLNSDIFNEEKANFQSKYRISQYQQLPFCIVVPTFNNTQNKRHLKNIRSILMQDYGNYHIVVIDDASPDATGTQIANFLKESKINKAKYRLIVNPERKRAMHNLRLAANQLCQPEEIFLVVDGDDQLLGRQVLKVFNAAFQSHSAWFVYSNFISEKFRYGFSRPIPETVLQNNGYRFYPFVTSHLRAFYTKLFQNIKQEDLRDEDGEYFKSANDVAICVPVVEQSGLNTVYLPELLYVYNAETGLNNHQLRQGEQLLNSAKIRRKKAYKSLQALL